MAKVSLKAALMVSLVASPGPGWAAESARFYLVHRDYEDVPINTEMGAHPGEVDKMYPHFSGASEQSTRFTVPSNAFDVDIRDKVHLGDILHLADMTYGPPDDLTALDWLEQAQVKFARNGGTGRVTIKGSDRAAWGASDTARPTMGKQLFDRDDNGALPEFVFRWNIHSGNQTIYCTHRHNAKDWYVSPRGEISLTPYNWWQGYHGFFMRVSADTFTCLSELAGRERLEDHILDTAEDAH